MRVIIDQISSYVAARREAHRDHRIKIMAAVIAKLVLPVIVMVLVFSAVLGAARPLAGEEWVGEATAAGDSVVRFIRQVYLQQLQGPGHSCSTWNPNGGC
uniref:Uncharacterized protein n=2 Tax=Avena sativa TaxID=4498 RepID=A0ACD5YKB4_AVESA